MKFWLFVNRSFTVMALIIPAVATVNNIFAEEPAGWFEPAVLALLCLIKADLTALRELRSDTEPQSTEVSR